MGRRRRRRRRSVNKPEASAPAPVARPIARPTQRPSANLTSTQDALQRLRANRPDFMKPRPMTNQGNMATNMSQAIQAQSMRMAPKGYKPPANRLPQLKTNPDGSLIPGQLMPPKPNRGKGGQIPVGGKGGQRPLVHGGPGTGVAGPRLGPDDRPLPPRPQRPMGGGGKGGMRPAGFGGKGGQRPSPSMGRPNPFSGMSQAQIGAMSENRAQPVTSASSDQIKLAVASAMPKKAPAFKMRSGNSTTFKEMGSGKKKSAPVKKTGRGYKMPGFGKR